MEHFGREQKRKPDSSLMRYILHGMFRDGADRTEDARSLHFGGVRHPAVVRFFQIASGCLIGDAGKAVLRETERGHRRQECRSEA